MAKKKEPKRLPPALEVLRKARAQLKKGWTKGAWDEGGKVCIQGAISKGYGADEGSSVVQLPWKTKYGYPETVGIDETPAGRAVLKALSRDQLIRIIAEEEGWLGSDEDYAQDELRTLRSRSMRQLRDRVSLPTWNDVGGTKKKEVLETVDRAIARLEQKRKADAARRR